jgi:hypothetical protein
VSVFVIEVYSSQSLFTKVFTFKLKIYSVEHIYNIIKYLIMIIMITEYIYIYIYTHTGIFFYLTLLRQPEGVFPGHVIWDLWLT